MTIDKWITDRTDDNFIIEDEDGQILYDARKTTREPAYYIMDSMVIDTYTWHGVTVLTI